MYCPKCKCEYREGFTICSDCQVKLVEQLEISKQLKSPEWFDYNIEDCNPIKLTAASNEIDAQIISNLLKSNNIPCLIKRKGSGGYMQVYMGYTVFGEEIYVSERDYSTALDLLTVLQPVEEQKDITENESNTHTQFYMNKRILLIIFRIIFFSYVGITLLFYIISNIIYR